MEGRLSLLPTYTRRDEGSCVAISHTDALKIDGPLSVILTQMRDDGQFPLILSTSGRCFYFQQIHAVFLPVLILHLKENRFILLFLSLSFMQGERGTNT